MNLQANATFEPRELVELIPALINIRDSKMTLTAAAPVDIKAGLKGRPSDSHVWIFLKADPGDQLAFHSNVVSFYQPSGERMSLNCAGDIGSSGIGLARAKLQIGESVFSGRLNVKYVRQGNSPDIDLLNSPIDFEFSTERQTDVLKLASIIDPSIYRQDVQGKISGSFAVSGTVAQPRPVGNLKFDSISCAGYGLQELSGSVVLQKSGSEKRESGHLKLSRVRFKNLTLSDVNADLLLLPGGHGLVSILSNGTASVADGTVSLNGSYDWTNHKLSLRSTANKIKAGLLSEVFFGHAGELSGLADGSMTLSAEGKDYKTAIANMSGQGQMTLHNGAISRFGQLQAKITQANLLRQGLFGFNLNNLLQSVYPVRTGLFRKVSARIEIDRGVMEIADLKYDGDDMRLWGSGKANLNLDTLDLEIAGKIPRVSNSVLGGPVGEVSRALTIQKMMNVVTMHQLESLPALPVLGEIAGSDKPRTFSFKVISPMDDPKLLTQSIEKSFHWLPTKPAASAHPLPGLKD
ncbi:MAG TPA: AsmA-like C-terminal region-containing protein, partial [Chroococcales cyanobacterium]